MERKERRHRTRELKLEAVRLAAVGDKTKAKVVLSRREFLLGNAVALLL